AFHPHAHRCRQCGEPLEVEPGDACGADLNPPWGVGAAGPEAVAGGLWRYLAALPPIDPGQVARVRMGEGGTPLLRAPRLGRQAGCRDLWLKDESRNPTGSFKDRGTAVALAVLASAGVKAVGTVSTGNMARSVASYAARAGLAATVWVGAGTAAEKLAPISVHGARLLRIDAPYGEIYEASLQWGRVHGVAFVNSDAALRVEGQKTIAYEIGEQLGSQAPDWVVVPTSSGGNLSAISKGFQEAVEWGWLERSPRMVAVQAAGCAPIACAWQAGEEKPLPVGALHTVAAAIANPSPPSGARALAWLRRTGGVAVEVSDEQILGQQRQVASLAGRYLQPASAAGLAGLMRLREQGTVAASDTVVVVLTGAGSNAPPPELPMPEIVSLDDVRGGS
ncbi:MAG: threonine synthase, partial [Acidobacteriota bacterium]